MRHKRTLATIGMLVFLFGVSISVLVILLKHEPSFYRELAIAPSPQRKKASQEFQTHFFDLMNSITNNEANWGDTFTAEQFNSYFQEDLGKSGALEALWQKGIHDPRIALESERVRLAFRYGKGFWSTIISINLKVWLVAHEPNVVAMELERLQAGAIPITAQSLLEYATEAARQLNIEVNWYRHHGNPVALLRFQADQVRPTVQMLRLQVQSGQLLIAGRSLEPSVRSYAAAKVTGTD